MLCILVDCNSVSENHIGFSGCFSYGVDEGPCTFDAQCKDSLFCGYKNCQASDGNNDVNCCGKNEFKSPNYPNRYFPLDEKTWLITAPVGSIIILQFHSFSVRLITDSKTYSNKIFRHLGTGEAPRHLPRLNLTSLSVNFLAL